MSNLIKKYLRIHFGFSKSESRGTLVLLSIITTLLITITVLKFLKNNKFSKELSTIEIETLEKSLNCIEKRRIQNSKSKINQVSSQETITLSTESIPIQKSFNEKSRLQKKFNSQKRIDKDYNLEIFDINIATIEQLKKIKGIGEILSKRIIKFRDKLGGFVSKYQYNEVYALKSEVVEELSKYSFIDKAFAPKKIFINKATIKILVSHPYIKYENAVALIRHIEQEGPFKSKKDLTEFCKKINLKYEKIEPYMSI